MLFIGLNLPIIKAAEDLTFLWCSLLGAATELITCYLSVPLENISCKKNFWHGCFILCQEQKVNAEISNRFSKKYPTNLLSLLSLFAFTFLLEPL